HHGQQASKGNGEKRHRELWPAYNVNAAPPQASTEGLFQQTLNVNATLQHLEHAQRIVQCPHLVRIVAGRFE
ncbi:MAG: hypothetical protein ABSG08_20470, partial [Terriglobales bacterium]